VRAVCQPEAKADVKGLGLSPDCESVQCAHDRRAARDCQCCAALLASQPGVMHSPVDRSCKRMHMDLVIQ